MRQRRRLPRRSPRRPPRGWACAPPACRPTACPPRRPISTICCGSGSARRRSPGSACCCVDEDDLRGWRRRRRPRPRRRRRAAARAGHRAGDPAGARAAAHRRRARRRCSRSATRPAASSWLLWRESLGEPRARARRSRPPADAVQPQPAGDPRHRRRGAGAHRRLAAARRSSAAIWDLCRRRLRSALDGLAQRIESTLALGRPGAAGAAEGDAARRSPPSCASAPRSTTTGASRRSRSAGLGISALFHGPSGTGKTMAAEVLAERAAARSLPHRPLARRQQVHRRDRGESAPGVRRRRGERRDPAVRRGRQPVRRRAAR